MRSRSTRILLIAAVVAGVVLISMLVGLAGGLIGHVSTDIDINSGRLRERRQALRFVLHEQVTETAFSHLARRYGPSSTSAVWKPARYRALGISQYFGPDQMDYELGRAVSTCKNAVRLFELQQFGEEEKRTMISSLLRLLREGNVEGMDAEVMKADKKTDLQTAPPVSSGD